MLSFYPQQSKNKKQIALQYQQKGLNLQHIQYKEPHPQTASPPPPLQKRGEWIAFVVKFFPPLRVITPLPFGEGLGGEAVIYNY